MAKSIRSKWKRAMRKEKRKVNAVRDLERLKRITANFSVPQLTDENMVSVEKPIYNAPTTAPLGGIDVDKPEAMETKTRDPVTLRDEDGQYPEWMNQRQIQKKKAQLKAKKAARRPKHLKRR